MLNTAKGPQTEGDAARAAKTWAMVGNTKEANQFIIDLMEAMATGDIWREQFYSKAIPIAESRGGKLWEIGADWERRQPSIFTMPSMQKWMNK